MRARMYIAPQRYPCYNGSRPLSWAIWLKQPWRRRQFVGYSWSFSGAWRAAQLIKQVLP
jgi:hypothetical protein